MKMQWQTRTPPVERGKLSTENEQLANRSWTACDGPRRARSEWAGLLIVQNFNIRLTGFTLRNKLVHGFFYGWTPLKLRFEYGLRWHLCYTDTAIRSRQSLICVFDNSKTCPTESWAEVLEETFARKNSLAHAHRSRCHTYPRSPNMLHREPLRQK